MNALTKPLKVLYRVFASYGLAALILILLGVITFQGTLEQQESPLIEVQQKYFNSVLVQPWDGVPIWLPGAWTLMAVLTVNLVLGGFVRILAKALKYPSEMYRTAGVLIIHAGILLLVAASAVKFYHSTDGHLTLYEAERGAAYQSYHDWEVAVRKVNDGDRTVIEHLIDGDQFTDLELGEARRFQSSDIPFDLVLEGFQKNSEPRAARGDTPARSIDGFYLQALPGHPEKTEYNIAGVYAMVRGKDGTEERGILWGAEAYPWTVSVGGETWQLALRHTTWNLPFEVVLDNFNRELHPGTSMASDYSSEITRIDDGRETKHKVLMNEPVREQGYVLYQASWGPEGAPPGSPLFSSLAVAENPSDKWPEISCYIIALGMVVHFLIVFARFIARHFKALNAAGASR